MRPYVFYSAKMTTAVSRLSMIGQCPFSANSAMKKLMPLPSSLIVIFEPCWKQLRPESGG
jgi:hypothetical protein